MKKNLILTAAVGLNFKQVEFFIRSLRKVYTDDICFIVGHNDHELKLELEKYDCTIIETHINKKKIQFKRYEIFSKYLDGHQFNKVLLSDSRDVYFQENPFKFNFNGPINFFLEDHLIKNCSYNSNWIIKTYGKSEFEKVSNKTILCSGTVLGNYEKIKEYLNLIKVNINKYKYKKKLKYFITFRPDPEGRGCDQGHANYIIHNSKLNGTNLYSNAKGPIATALYLKNIIFDNKYRLVNELGDPYLVVHQYDKRWSEFSENIKKFKSLL